jgi:hypothetical protein
MAPALHVLYSVNAVRVDTNLRAGLGLFQTDSATAAELSSDSALALDSLTDFRGADSLYVQHAVRNEALTSDPSLFVQTSVRASQLESLARNVRLDSFNSALSGVNSLLDPFALGSPLVAATTPLSDALEKERQTPANSSADKDTSPDAVKQAPASVVPSVRASAEDAPAPQVKRRAADGFASQLRQNAASFRTSAVRPETPVNESARAIR